MERITVDEPKELETDFLLPTHIQNLPIYRIPYIAYKTMIVILRKESNRALEVQTHKV